MAATKAAHAALMRAQSELRTARDAEDAAGHTVRAMEINALILGVFGAAIIVIEGESAEMPAEVAAGMREEGEAGGSD